MDGRKQNKLNKIKTENDIKVKRKEIKLEENKE